MSLPETSTAATRWYALAFAVVVADQVSKWFASNELSYSVPVKVLAWFNLTLHHNQGAAFSFLADAGGWQRWFFAALALGVSGMIMFWLRDLKPSQWPLSLALALVLGGALGNLVDRIHLGYVVDFISVHYRNRYFPTFNVADAAISVGAFLIIVDSLFGSFVDEQSADNGQS
ncbi:signal peptidase II [Congregibacter variabilis]|uniref:Lipoprotein signal peptidase n=1 Tax=Congregibacter variabilis TaxID=3081200 RepID=A0ABZ0I1R0_9GAMM|nr:signal peptidase II [Congregibacter sp. IMCC43200]